MSNNIDNRQGTLIYDSDAIRNDRVHKKTITDNQPTISISENVEQISNDQVAFDELKNTFEGLRDGSNLSHELQTLISTIVSSAVVETASRPLMQNTSTDIQNTGGSDAIESSGPANNKGAMRRLQQVLSSDSRVIQQLMDYLQLSSPARKDEHIQSMGLEYKDLPPTLNGYQAKRGELFEAVEKHINGNIDKSSLKHQLQPVISYLDPAIIVIDNTLKMEEARWAHEQRK
ncbi:MAG: hypothetical protein QS748_09170 [Candidatus Endonucleobacter bathymodioli]|uniref:Uncharacterized protein n=1 Tax=Candidatus Endonucleibacter bathymodioli TaxID=539814 RepID=A0AA90NMK3_9GAMM|nr:hypothetical protein [Candidatus Endonucleobacter bathymodioli]